ncbi:Gfo/Idh/MocA family protein [Streptomyces pathocidini]|uniref:Gfo/Idh/MocA family protein n=1 Tax=Streptomyces pathocidini TaxID=1650571 RepID=A0ABW7UUT1_9ACTN|nr:Gfo/Idh/MocA family oxidoreductase [Streptomyces pathocidini]
MTRVLLIGAGEVGAKHLTALEEMPDVVVCAVADPSPPKVRPGVPLLAGWRAALRATSPELVIVATPPGIALTAARAAAETGATVLVEKPVVVDPAALVPQAGDERIFVGFQPHFAPGLAALFREPPAIRHAEVILACRRDRGYYRDWRTRYATAGGILHQQAIHGLALALRLMTPDPVLSCRAQLRRWRGWAEPEDRIEAELTFAEGRSIAVRARVDDHGTPRHEVLLHLADGRQLPITGRNLEHGLGPAAAAPSHQSLRLALYRALTDAAAGGAAHPCLFPLAALRRPLEVIDHVYRDAHGNSPAGSAA